MSLLIYYNVSTHVCRSDMAWKKVFKEADLRLVREQVQEGLPEGLFVVKMCVAITSSN